MQFMRITKTPQFLFLFLLICSNIYANEVEDYAKKSERYPGYILTLDEEKIEGDVLVGSITDREAKIQFIAEGTEKKKTYKAKELAGYGFESVEEDDLGLEYKRWIHFEQQKVDYPPKPFASTTVFMQKEESGALELYTYYMEVRNDRKNPFKYQYYIKDDKGKLVKVEKGDFRKVAGRLFKDYSAMYAKIGKKDFQFKNLDRMVRDYNYWSTNQHSASEYRVALKQ